MKPWKRQKRSWTDRRYKSKSITGRHLEGVRPRHPLLSTWRAKYLQGAQCVKGVLALKYFPLCWKSFLSGEVHLCRTNGFAVEYTLSSVAVRAHWESCYSLGGHLQLGSLLTHSKDQNPSWWLAGEPPASLTVYWSTDLHRAVRSRFCSGCKLSGFNTWILKKTDKKLQ